MGQKCKQVRDYFVVSHQALSSVLSLGFGFPVLYRVLSTIPHHHPIPHPLIFPAGLAIMGLPDMGNSVYTIAHLGP